MRLPLAFARRLRSRDCSIVPPARLAAGVAQLARCALSSRFAGECGRKLRVACAPRPSPSRACGVGQLVSRAAPVSFSEMLPRASRPYGELVASFATGDGHPVEPLADVRGADARSAQIRRPDGISQCFQVKRNSVEPRPSSRARNLFSKHDCRAALGDKPVEFRPEMPLVIGVALAAGVAERLAGAGAGPRGEIVGPAGEAQGVGPSADPGEGVELHSASNVGGLDSADVALDDRAGRDAPGSDEVAEPLRGVWVIFIVHPQIIYSVLRRDTIAKSTLLAQGAQRRAIARPALQVRPLQERSHGVGSIVRLGRERVDL